ncbi:MULTISPECIES: hypothetical protein [Mycobacterium]|uniref:hypothetical protein n=1 Tax=Mycobacterium TaxID=1763 RepID=UPI001CDA2FE9|nr:MULTISPECIES: hypothetical protein [Mycobacterium]MEE3754845.1 hypothetical protein [Mycobacterium intracellulare]
MRLRVVVAIAAAVWLVLGALGCGLVHFAPLAFDPPHAFVTAPGGGSGPGASDIQAQHASLYRGLVAKCSKVFGAMPVSGPVTALVELGLAVAVVAVAGSRIKLVVPVGRAPPRAAAIAFNGQDLLTRFCIARR